MRTLVLAIGLLLVATAPAAALRLTGTVLGTPDRAEELATYTEATFAAVDQALAQVPRESAPARLPCPRPG